MFADMELMGISHRIVVGERGLKKKTSNTRAVAMLNHKLFLCKTQ